MTEENNNKKNIIITGFMGTGKTAVGRTVAELLNRVFIDTDETIQKRVGKSTPQIFAQLGEVYFRKQENTLVEELSSKRSLVISTGGGTILSKGNFHSFRKTGYIFCLTARPEIIQQRLADNTDRPLLGISPSIDGIKKLLEERKAKYDKIAFQIDTSDITIQRIAETIVELINGMAE